MAQKICRGCPILWGGPGHHTPGYFLTTRRVPRGQKMKPKGKATPSSLRNWRGARKERVPTISKSDWLFSKNGALPSRRNCRLFSKMTDYFLLAPKLVRRFYFSRPTIPPRLGLYNTICQEGWGDNRPLGPTHCIGAPLPNGLLSPPAALRSEASKRSCRELSPGPRCVACFHIFTCFLFFLFFCFAISVTPR